MFKNSVVRGLQVNSFENILRGTKKMKQKKENNNNQSKKFLSRKQKTNREK